MTRATTNAAVATPEMDSAGRRVLVRAEQLQKRYASASSEIVILNGLDLSVAEGELIAIVGPSGVGKSTLLHVLGALDTPTSGTVYFDGRAVNSFGDAELAEFHNRQVGFVWQRHHLLADFTAGENVAMPLLSRGAGRGQALDAAREWLGEVGLGDRFHHRGAELSGGEQQRVAIARALVNQPRLLLADEPTGDLDAANAEAVFDLLARLHRTHRLTTVLATHNLSLARRADRLLQLAGGVLVSGPVAQLG